MAFTSKNVRLKSVADRKWRWLSACGKNRLGFTLMEVMISVCITGVISGIATPIYMGHRDRARHTLIISEMKTIEVALFNFRADNEMQLPDTLAEAGVGGMNDPWGRPYQYLRIDGGGAPPGSRRKDHFMVPVNSDFDLYSMGPDGASVSPFTAAASRDDIVRAYDGAYYGKVSDL